MGFKLLLTTAIFVIASCTLSAQRYLEMIASGDYPVTEIIETAEAYFEGKDKGRGSGYKQFKRWEYNAIRSVKENGFLPSIPEQLSELQRYNAYLNETASSRQALNDNWQELGPSSWSATTSWNPGVGRITGIAIDPANEDHIIIGANTGGVWRTVDGGQNWLPLGDTFTNLTVYSVAMHPTNSNTYYFGSGNGLIFESTDAGATWSPKGSAGNDYVNKIVINPTNTDMMFATSDYSGIYRSVDAGNSWTKVVASESYGYDIEFKPNDVSTVYVTGTGFHKSTDGGATFTTIPGFNGGVKMIGVSEDDPDRVYLLEANGGSFGAFYVSTDSGSSFTELNHSGRNYFGYDTNGFESGGQAPRDMDVAVNPSNADEVHIAGVLTWRSLNGGVDFTCTSDWIPNAAANANIGYCHADVDLLMFYGETLYTGTDGGIFKAENTTNLTANYYEDITTGIGIRQFYRIGISQSANVVVTGGSQDNGTSFYTEAAGWRDWLGADGMEGFIDKNNTNVMYGTTQGGQLYRTDNAASTYTGLSEPGQGGGNWVTPFEQDPIVTNTVYVGYNRIHKSANKGNTWTTISQNFGSNIEELKIAPSNNQIMYATNGGSVYKTEDGGASNWELMMNLGGTISSIAVHPTKPYKIAVATTGNLKVYVSNDGGDTWENYKLNLPNFSARAVVWDDNGADGLYLGMNYGIYYIDEGLTEWQPFSNNLPNVIVNELEVNTVTGTLYAGTYGRGLWVSPLAEASVLGTSDNAFASGIVLHPNPANNEFTIETQVPIGGDVRLYDVTGKLVRFIKDVEISRNKKFDITDLNPGIYFVRINSERGTATKKLLKN